MAAMPSPITYRDNSFVNLGPLTTTFAPPASCFAATTGVQIAFSSDIEGNAFQTNCGKDAVHYGDCFPSGNALDSIRSSLWPSPTPIVMAYYSPGLYCPAGWTVAGEATKTDDGAPVTSGAFSLIHHPTNIPADFAQFEPNMQVLLDVLGTGETAMLCCPSTAKVNPYGYCYSTLPKDVYQPPPTACQLILPNEDVATTNGTFVVGGKTTTSPVVEITGTVAPSARTTTFAASDTAQLLGVTVFPMLTLLHKGNDVPTTTGSSGSNPSSSSPGGASSKNAAGSLRVAHGKGFIGQWLLASVVAAVTAGAVAVVL